MNKALSVITGLAAVCILTLSFGLSDVAAAEKKIKLRMAVSWQDKDDRVDLIRDFIKTVNSRTNGNVDITMFAGGAIASDKDMKSAIPKGMVDLGQCNLGMWLSIVPEISILTSLGFFDDPDHCWRVIDGELGRILEKTLEEKGNSKVIAWLDSGAPDAVVGRKGLIQSVDDLKGLKMRVPSRQFGIALETLGGSPVLMSSSELYLSTQKGVIDGIFSTSVNAATGLKLQEVAECWTRIMLLPGVNFGILMNLDKWNKMPADVQTVLLDAGKEMENWMRQNITQKTENAWAQLAKRTENKVYIVPKEDALKWNEKIFPDQLAELKKLLPADQADHMVDLVQQARPH